MATPDTSNKIICQNRKATFLYYIEERFEAGIVLTGTEVKSLRKGRASIVEAYGQPMGSELFIVNFHIPPYEQGNIHNPDPTRMRKLLLHRRQIDELIGAVTRKGYTLVPISIYFKKGRAKVELGIGKGKKAYDKREDIKKKDLDRDMRRDSRETRRRED